ncbi:imidazole glycerol phosphate synthase subunit HisH [Caldithrix abyssi]|uniref:Imidazole glycerol phosphate synthase subunit HisH n=1 Tax=Caldithrix abyssi DSM 13497 TaxID=880073 RepID=H1XWS8_CALAY|nr:imidazole glycerol phosphate synthase subunit HisH [Caldithrix abyssi]APF19127.1 hisH glutamine amidotransferase [Caldithrix abyssi DSM 13497]EHO43054.1 Imidazole glycerol phosphate synthase subunit hisH [Caldithrix abyssi DSM 13497]
MKVAIVKYNAGNIHSVTLALQRLGIEPQVTDDPAYLQNADRVIFPGVGEASTAMRYLKAHGLDDILRRLKQPVLGICLGLQLLCQHSQENDTPGLGIFPVEVKRFPPEDKVPHMGWNSVSNLKGPLFRGVPEESFVYFVHGYYAELSPFTIARSEYILPFSAALQKDNFLSVQFHPEKSGKVGEQILKNFLEIG